MNALIYIVLGVVGLLVFTGAKDLMGTVNDYLAPLPISIIPNNTANVNMSNVSSETNNSLAGEGNTSTNISLPSPPRITHSCYWQQWKFTSWLCPTAEKTIEKVEHSGWATTIVGGLIAAVILFFLFRILFNRE